MSRQNDNADGQELSPILVLKPTGNGKALYRTLARVLVRQELIFARLIAEPSDCEIPRAAG